ncbi:hypothetical protein ABBQ38_009643 [Trebouxia sp. C0009 RCD-2024]
MSGGGILGFACEHAYPREAKVAGLAGFLKGADAVVLAAAKHLKLTATFLPIWQCSGDYESDASEDARGWTRWRMPRDSEDEDSEYADLKDDDLKDDDIEIVVIDQEPFQGVLGKSFDAQMHDIYDEDFDTEVRTQLKGSTRPKKITWCTGDRRAWSEDHAVATYGNEPASRHVYSAAAILVRVPAWSKRS